MDTIKNQKLQNREITEGNKILMTELLKSIERDKKKQFNTLISKYKDYLKQKPVKDVCSECRLNKNSDTELLCDLFKTSLKQSNKYYREALFELNNKYSIVSSQSTELLRIAIQENNVELAHKFVKNGADLTDLDSLCCTPLEDAIRCNNLEMICMLLYYGGYTNNIENNLTSFMFSIICQCSEEIQRILMEYETDYNLCCNFDSTLFMALKYHSPLIFDLIERGADPNHTKPSFRGTVIAPFVAIQYNCDKEILRKLWKVFDYNVWKNFTYGTSPSSVLCRCSVFFSGENIKLNEYLLVFLEDEKKLKLEIEHHESIESKSLVYDLYSRCMWKELDESLVQNYILNLLSYGAAIYLSDLDIFYSQSSDKESNFLQVLLSMDLLETSANQDKITFMYFKYTLVPNLDIFLKKLLESYQNPISIRDKTNITDVRDAICKISQLFAFKHNIKNDYQDVFKEDPEVISSLEFAECFPSLQQLSRDASRSALCEKYNIQHISQFYNMINNLNVPNFVKFLLTYKQKIYRIY